MQQSEITVHWLMMCPLYDEIKAEIYDKVLDYQWIICEKIHWAL